MPIAVSRSLTYSRRHTSACLTLLSKFSKAPTIAGTTDSSSPKPTQLPTQFVPQYLKASERMLN